MRNPDGGHENAPLPFVAILLRRVTDPLQLHRQQTETAEDKAQVAASRTRPADKAIARLLIAREGDTRANLLCRHPSEIVSIVPHEPFGRILAAFRHVTCLKTLLFFQRSFHALNRRSMTCGPSRRPPSLDRRQ